MFRADTLVFLILSYKLKLGLYYNVMQSIKSINVTKCQDKQFCFALDVDLIQEKSVASWDALTHSFFSQIQVWCQKIHYIFHQIFKLLTLSSISLALVGWGWSLLSNTWRRWSDDQQQKCHKDNMGERGPSALGDSTTVVSLLERRNTNSTQIVHNLLTTMDKTKPNIAYQKFDNIQEALALLHLREFKKFLF